MEYAPLGVMERLDDADWLTSPYVARLLKLNGAGVWEFVSPGSTLSTPFLPSSIDPIRKGRCLALTL